MYRLRAALTLIAITSIAGNTAADESPVRIGVIGLTHTHVHWIFESDKREDFEIVGIVESNRELARRYSEQHGFDMALIYDSIGGMLDAAKPEGVTAFGTIFDRQPLQGRCSTGGGSQRGTST